MQQKRFIAFLLSAIMVLTILPMGSIALNQGVITVENWKEADLTSDKYIFNACNAAPGYDEVYGDYVALTATNYGQYAAINFDCDLSAYSDPVVGMLLLDASGTPTCTISAMVDGVDEEGNSVSNAVSVLTFTGVQNEWGFRMAALAVDGTTLTEISGIKVQPSSYSKLRIGAIYIGERRDVEKLSPEYVEPLPYEVVEDWSDPDLGNGDEIAGLHIPVDSGSIVRRTITASVNNDEYGLIDPLGDTLVREGYGKTFTFYPYAGHYIEAILIDGVAIDLVNDEGYDALTGTYTFTNVILDHTIEIVYAVTYLTVVFVDWDNTELDRQQVAFGAAATAPADPQREGYTFVGWDQTFTSVRRDMTVTAVYEENAIVIVGDVNGDGVLDVGDALAIMRYVVGFTDGTGYNMDNGDYNGDGTVDMGDALGILRAAAMKRGAAGSQRREDVK